MPELSSAKKFQFIGGNLALDFCNTVGGKRGGIARENLNSYFDLVAWCFQAGLLDRVQTEACLQDSERQPDSAAAVLARAVELREALFRIFEALIAKKSLPRRDLELLNSELARSLGRMQLIPPKNGHAFVWRWATDQRALDHALGPIAHAAAMLLTDPQHLGRVEICHGDTCGWLFVDLSKNHSRRWCDMRDCGNRAKIRRHRLKQRKHEH
jgi:predicted RNA-binding Zn ribbon-like protein